MNIIEEIKDSFRTGSVLTRLIYINLGVFITINLLLIFFKLSGSNNYIDIVISYLAVPASFSELILKPWTLITYMFTHKDFFHILFNILWLYWFGKIFLSYLSGRQLLSVYILGGISGALLVSISYYIFPGLSQEYHFIRTIGASASIMSIVFAISFLVPDYKMYVVFVGPVKIIYIALIAFVFTSLIDFTNNTGGKIAHIGGAAFGYLYTYRYNRGKDISIWFSKILEFFSNLFTRKEKMKVTHKKPVSDYEYNKQKAASQKEVDRVLDKISKSGYDSLTKEEKELLFKMGK